MGRGHALAPAWAISEASHPLAYKAHSLHILGEGSLGVCLHKTRAWGGVSLGASSSWKRSVCL